MSKPLRGQSSSNCFKFSSKSFWNSPISISMKEASSGSARGSTPGSLKLVLSSMAMTKRKRRAAKTGMAGDRWTARYGHLRHKGKRVKGTGEAVKHLFNDLWVFFLQKWQKYKRKQLCGEVTILQRRAWSMTSSAWRAACGLMCRNRQHERNYRLPFVDTQSNNSLFPCQCWENDTKGLPRFVGRKEVEEMTQSGIHILQCLVFCHWRVLGHPGRRCQSQAAFVGSWRHQIRIPT